MNKKLLSEAKQIAVFLLWILSICLAAAMLGFAVRVLSN